MNPETEYGAAERQRMAELQEMNRRQGKSRPWIGWLVLGVIALVLVLWLLVGCAPAFVKPPGLAESTPPPDPSSHIIFGIRGLETGVRIPASDLVRDLLLRVCRDAGGEIDIWTIMANLDGRTMLDRGYVCRMPAVTPEPDGA